MLWILGLHAPGLLALGLALGYTPRTLTLVVIPPLALVGLGHLLRHHRRPTSITVTVGLVYCSAALVVLTHGTIEAHFHFFVIIGFIALYQDWAPFLVNIVFTVISHGIGSAWQQTLIFDHVEGQEHPWLWSLIHGVAVLVACAGALLVLRVTEDTQREKDVLGRRLADSEINRRQFTSDLLTNLARRNQSLLHRQLEIINQLEESERDPDALSDLFALDHIATRVRRNAENLLVLAGEQPPRTWSEPVPLRDVLRAAIAETENLERVVFVVDEKSAVVGHTVIDLTHLLAELTENAVRFSPPDTTVTVRSRPDRARPGGRLITIEDWGLGMPAEQIEEANALLASPPDIDLGDVAAAGLPRGRPARDASRHQGGAERHTGFGHHGARLPAAVALRPALPRGGRVRFGGATGRRSHRPPRRAAAHHTTAAPPPVAAPSTAPPRTLDTADWQGWWDPAVASAMPAFNPTPAPVSGAGPAIGESPVERLRQRIRGSPDRGPRPRRQRPRRQRLRPTAGPRPRSATATAATVTAPPTDTAPRERHQARHPHAVGRVRITTPPPPTSTDPPPTAWTRQPMARTRSAVAPERSTPVSAGWARPTPAPSAWSSAPMTSTCSRAARAAAGGPTTRSSSAACGAPTAPRTRTRTARARASSRAPAPRPTAPRPGRPCRPCHPFDAVDVDAVGARGGDAAGRAPAAPPVADPATPRRRRPAAAHGHRAGTTPLRPGRPGQRPAPPRAPVAPLRPAPHPGARGGAPVLDRPSTADAAAALSRYQASRAAAQARVGGTLPTGPRNHRRPR